MLILAGVGDSDETKTGLVLFANSVNVVIEPYDSPPKLLLRDVVARGDAAFVEYRTRGKKLDESQM
ncbi:MAG TPA: hypothetical protein VF692_00035, partial [Pyrinomonadaceae bacterium]